MDICNVIQWAGENRLSLNAGKTSAIIFGTGKYIRSLNRDNLSQVDGEVIPFKDTVLYLGVTLTSVLSWELHVSNVVSRVNSTLYRLKIYRHLLSQELRIRLVSILLLPYFDYCCTLLTDINGENNLRLQRALNACVRFIYRVKWYEHITPYFDELAWLKIKPRRSYFIGCLVYRMLETHRPQILSSLIYSPLGEMIVSMTLDCRTRDYFSLSVELSYLDALLDVHVSTSGILYRRTSARHRMESSKAVSMLICYTPSLYNLYRIWAQFSFSFTLYHLIYYVYKFLFY